MDIWTLVGMHGYKVVDSIHSGGKLGMEYGETWFFRETDDGLEIVLLLLLAQCVPTKRKLNKEVRL